MLDAEKKDQESTDQDKKEEDQKDEQEIVENESSGEEVSDSLEDLKDEVAEAYLLSLDAKKEGIVWTVAEFWIALNPLHKLAKNYLLDKSDFLDPKKKKLFSKFKAIILEKMGTWNAQLPDNVSELFNIAYDKLALDKMKELILQNKDNKAMLENIKQQIAEWKDPILLSSDASLSQSSVENTTAASQSWAENNISSQSSQKESEQRFSGLFEWLIVWWTLVVLNNEDIKYVRETVGSLKPEIIWDFASIEKIKDKEDNIILECSWKTPYINKNIITDLLGFASLFYKKTGKPLTLNSAYRTIAQQKELDDENDANAAEPGYSWHNLWLSIDVESSDRKTKTLWWLKGFRELAQKFNFKPIQSEDWHFDHITLPKADNRLAFAQNLDQEFNKSLAA
jgi:hypothetical protein